MKNSLLVILFFLINYNGYSQNPILIKSEIFKDSKKRSVLNYSLEDKNGGLITIRSFYGGLRQKIKGYYIQQFDDNLKLLKEVEYNVDGNVIKNAFVKNNQVHLVEYIADTKSDRIAFNVVSIDLKTFRFSKKEILSFSEKEQQKYFGFGIFPFLFSNKSQLDGNHTGEVVLSDNNQHFVINFDIKNKDIETHRIFVFDDNFEKKYDRLIQKNTKDKYFEYNSIDIDDDGTVFFLGKFYENESRKSKRKGQANYHFELFKVNENEQLNISFKYEDKFIASLKLVKTDDRLVCVGFYGDKNEYRVNGCCLINLNPSSLEIDKEKFNPFSQEFLTDKYGNKEGKKARKKEKGIEDIEFRGIYVMNDGDIIMNAEEFYFTTSMSTDANGNMRSYTVYHFDDIMSIRMNKNGDLQWARNINKRQIGFANSSYTSIPVGKDSYFFINCSDNIKKLSADRIEFKQSTAKKSNLYMIKINQDGDFFVEKLIDDKESKVYYKVFNGNVNLDNRTVVLTGKRKKNTRILKIKM